MNPTDEKQRAPKMTEYTRGIPMIIGIVCLGIVTDYTVKNNVFIGDLEHIFFLIVTYGFSTMSLFLIVSGVMSEVDRTALPKSLFELMYHFWAFIFFFSASLALLLKVARYSKYYPSPENDGKIAAASLGIINSVIYSISLYYSFRSYNG